MSSRLPATPAFGLVAWLEATRIVLPLKGVECRFDVTAGVASVEIDQIFHQSHAQPLDCTYTFPLPAGAAVYRCVMQVNGRTISARIEAREEAKRIFLENKMAGRRAALVETERENLFTLTLGNVQPGDVIVVQLAYFQTLERVANVLSLRVPVCPGVRYIPGAPLLRARTDRAAPDRRPAARGARAGKGAQPSLRGRGVRRVGCSRAAGGPGAPFRDGSALPGSTAAACFSRTTPRRANCSTPWSAIRGAGVLECGDLSPLCGWSAERWLACRALRAHPKAATSRRTPKRLRRATQCPLLAPGVRATRRGSCFS